EAAPASTYTPGNRIQTEVYGDWWEVDKVGAGDNFSLLRGISVGLSRGQTLRLSAGTYATSLGSLTSNSTQFELPPETALAGAGMGVTLVTVSPWRNVLDAYTMVKCISGCTIRDIGLIGHAGSPTLVDADGTTTGTLGPTAIDAPDSAPLVVFDAATTGANLCTDSLTTPTKLYQKASGVCGTAPATGFLLNSGAVTGIASVLDTPWYFHDTNSSGTWDTGEDIFIGGSALQANGLINDTNAKGPDLERGNNRFERVYTYGFSTALWLFASDWTSEPGKNSESWGEDDRHTVTVQDCEFSSTGGYHALGTRLHGGYNTYRHNYLHDFYRTVGGVSARGILERAPFRTSHIADNIFVNIDGPSIQRESGSSATYPMEVEIARNTIL